MSAPPKKEKLRKVTVMLPEDLLRALRGKVKFSLDLTSCGSKKIDHS